MAYKSAIPMAFLALMRTTWAQRVTVPISFGWRTQNLQQNASCEFPTSLNGLQCFGLSLVPNITNAQGCETAACAGSQPIWQFLAAQQGCWVGSDATCDNSTDPWVGAGNFEPTPPPPSNAPEAQPGFDDLGWSIVDIPHDATITGNYTPYANGGEGYLTAALTWYRKHFVAPAAWSGSAVTLIVDAALSTTTWNLNGKQLIIQKPSAYLPVVIRLDQNGLNFGGNNVIAVYCDGSKTTGWWYEGSGLIRTARIISTAAAASVVPFGVSSPSYADGAIHNHSSSPSDGLYTDNAVMSPAVTVTGSASQVSVSFVLIAADGVTVVATGTGSGSGNANISSNYINIPNAELWSVARPYLYTLAITVSVGGSVVDAVNETVGIRNIAWDAAQGLFINSQPVKMRGGCNHESFTGVGAALPERIDLLRVQQMRGAGLNAWRTSHNPPEPVLLDITDRLGMLVLDENRVLATNSNCIGCGSVPTYAGDPAADVGALALRDRNHASVTWYSLCNEMGCGDGSLLLNDMVVQAKQAAYANDGSRNVGANTIGWTLPPDPRTPMSIELDVMGLSHAGSNTIDAFHNAEPDKPLVATECCSCETQRGEDGDLLHDATVFYTNENSECLSSQTTRSDTVPFVAGTFVWTFLDYIGEPGPWPHVSSSFGAIDLAGFPKAPAWFYRSIWLANISTDDAGRPPLPPATTAFTCRIVESWQPPGPGNTSRIIHVYSNAPLVSLWVNGVEVGAPTGVPQFGMATFPAVPYSPGILTAKALAADGVTVLATHNISSWGAPVAIVLTIDAPSPVSGTGSAVYLDGADVALIRATIIDAAGNVVRNATLNVTFGVTSGPGLIWGVGNGNPACQEPNNAVWRSAYHGLVRAIVRTTIDASGSAADRALRASVNVEAGLSPFSSSILQGSAGNAPTNITVTASAPGLPKASIVIPLSVNPADSVLAVALASVGTADIGSAD